MREHSRDNEKQSRQPRLEIVLKCDSAGTLEAVSTGISKIEPTGIEIHIISSGIGDITMSDIDLAATGSRLIAGYQVKVLPGLDIELHEGAVEVRLYTVIYTLINDIRQIALTLKPSVVQAPVIGSAKVIALFKSSRKGIIIGCEVVSGHLAVGQSFRIISAMGPLYSGRIESLHIEKNRVDKATPGQQVGIKIRDFQKVKVGDIVESFKPSRQQTAHVWHPTGEIIKY